RVARRRALGSSPTRRSSDLLQRMLAVEGAAEALGRVGDQLEAVLVADRLDGRVVGGLAEQVDGDDDAGLQPALGDRRLDGGLQRSEEHTSELQSRENLVCRL